MRTEGSLSYSQEPTNGPCPEPDESFSHVDILFKIHFNIILPSTHSPPFTRQK